MRRASSVYAVGTLALALSISVSVALASEPVLNIKNPEKVLVRKELVGCIDLKVTKRIYQLLINENDAHAAGELAHPFEEANECKWIPAGVAVAEQFQKWSEDDIGPHVQYWDCVRSIGDPLCYWVPDFRDNTISVLKATTP